MNEKYVAIGGAVLFLIGLGLALEGHWLVAFGQRTEAVVQSYEETSRTTSSGYSETRYKPVVRYTVDGEAFTYTSLQDYAVTPRAGQRMELIYRGSKPSHARLEKEVSGLGMGSAGGFILMAVGVYLARQQVFRLMVGEPKNDDDDEDGRDD